MKDHSDIIRAEVELLFTRLSSAARNGRGLQLRRQEIALACALISLAQEGFSIEAITHRITEQEDDRDD